MSVEVGKKNALTFQFLAAEFFTKFIGVNADDSRFNQTTRRCFLMELSSQSFFS